MFCRLCRKSSDCRAKEKECKDSDGKRCKSSMAGEAGPLTARLWAEADREVDPDMGRVCVFLMD